MTATLPPASQALREALGTAYTIDRELGRGGTATVYLAQDLRHNRLVALKVLHSDIAESLGAERFLREIQTAARLNHPHILPLFDSGATGRFLYYVMPYVEGESLRQALDRLGQIPADEAIAYAQELATALDYAHRQGIVHRDIKPENVMLHEGIATLMDFGIAKAVEPGSAGALTQTGMFVGTPAYISPEQAFGESAIDGRSDQFSLACMLYEMITGQQMFVGSTPQAVIAKRMSIDTIDLHELHDRVAPEVIGAIQRALSPEPSERYATMREFAANLAGGRTTPSSMRVTTPLTTSAAKSVAVLPFENQSSDRENDFLADGIAEEIINALSKAKSLRVASRTTSFALKGKTEDLQETGRKLKVSTILNGSLRRSGNRIRVSAELVNVSDGSQLWAERYDREMEDVFAIQDDISESIVRALRVILADSERKALKARTRDVRAYEYYLRGRQYSDFRRKSAEYALEMFRRAVEIDPEYGSAYAGIADSLSLLYFAFEENPQFLKDAEVASARALELEPDLAESHMARGMYLSCTKDYQKSNEEFETAMRLDPRLFEAPYYWGRNLIWQGKGDDAVKVFRAALALRPESYDVASMLSQAYAVAGRLAESEAARKRALKLVEERLELNPDDPRAWALGACNYAAQGDREKAEEAVRRALAIDTDAITYYNAACAYALLKDEDRSLDMLETAIRKGYHHKQWMSHDSDFDFLRDSERFREIFATM